MTKNHYGIAAFDPTHAHGSTLDLLMTDVHDLVQVPVVAPKIY